ncbi:MAG: ATP-dependent helicase [Lachnospiraceae bacterium]|nr:ATP-dependent helicase [Lachnospiraceae bacterium]
MAVNKEQKEAIEHNKGPAIVLAGPGSGKTFVITHRTKYLIERCGVNPANILVITFTKAAATEMRERFVGLYGEDGRKVNFGTFHAIFFTILKYAYNYNANNIIRNDQKQLFLKEIVGKHNIETEDEKELIANIEAEISLVKGEHINIKDYYSTSCSEDTFRKIYSEYNRRLCDNRLLDFDDMIVQCYDLFIKYDNILKIWQDRYQYILVDEFQDINIMQYEIVKMLAKPGNNLFIVGDDDQSIYRFRGAKPEIMLNFQNDYPDAKKIVLSINYRSTKNIVALSSKVIKNNKVRYDKNITTVNEEGKKASIVEFASNVDENKRIVSLVLDYEKNGININNIAVLYRTNTQPRQLVEKFMEYNIKFCIKDRLPSIFEHWVSKGLLDYMLCGRQISGMEKAEGVPDDKPHTDIVERKCLLNIINKPKRYVSRNMLNSDIINYKRLKDSYYDKDWMIEKLDKLEYDLKVIASMKPYDAVSYIRNAIGYDSYLKEYAKQKRINEEELMEICDEFTESTKDFNTYEEFMAHILKYNEELEKQSKNMSNREGVNFTTFHGSKGLEYDVVFIIDANEGITPYKKALLPEDIEEERRMFYVAMTRAKKELNIYYVKKRFNKDIDVSRFIGEIFVDRSELVVGTRIAHGKYGNGTIISIERGKMCILFDYRGLKKVLDINHCISSKLIRVL